ncbi:helix-turn-helix domain-containing protein [Candidatus Gottesmanbacteria bacterium]|nr:helix-turn-helix domain-containing protein [Candidatus Gottesmanbacteria bacterium]
MTQVSRLPLRKEIEKRIFEIFLNSLARVRQKEEVESFIQDLLSPIEKIMLAKRLSIAFLLRKGYDQRTISRILKVSLSTVNRVSLRLQLGGEGFNKVIGEIIRDEKRDDFWQKLDDFISEIVPPKGRSWSNVRRERWEAKLARQKPF